MCAYAARTMCRAGAHRPEESAGDPGTGVTGMGPLQEQQVLLTSEPSPYPHSKTLNGQKKTRTSDL